MHELSLCQAITATVHDRAPCAGRVRKVEVRIGYLRQVVPDSLLFSWQLLTDGTALAGAELAIEHVPAVVRCPKCDAETTLAFPSLLCGVCGGADVELIAGDEFVLVAIDVAEEVH